MDREQEEIQFLGFFGIIKESCNIVVSSWRKIFAQITLFLILPLSFIYLAHIQISQILFRNIMREEFVLDNTPENTRAYDRILSVLTSEWTYFFLFKIAYFVFFIVLALLSTSAVVYTVACIYTGKDITFKKVMSVVPKVWKRLVVTFIWNFIILFAYNIVSALAFILIVLVFSSSTPALVVFIVLFTITYLVGLLSITIVWHLASVVSVLEDSYGIEAMRKSQGLIKGKMGISVSIFLVLGLFLYGIQLIFEFLFVHGENGIASKIGYGILSLVLMSIWMVFGLIMQTIIYFICKSYHHENIDKSLLADHLEGYLGEYVPLKSKDVQLHQFDDEEV